MKDTAQRRYHENNHSALLNRKIFEQFGTSV